ncbi:TPA: ADP-ribosylglycohydrolase family protein [Aeromonas hydrophila subsp. hydrophila]|uniref:ADP-ribosylglycohydrolase family protein n=1 Tax=Aeromonas dhakensis TaxID=196024 RepID=UPI00388B25A7
MKNRQSASKGCLLGLAIGDALGTTLEFAPRDSYTTLTDMIGGGPFKLEAGQWTDDTSMALCLADSLLACHRHDPLDQLARYQRWYRQGENSVTGYCFDIGSTVRSALRRYGQSGDPYPGSEDAMSAGNGSLMRLAPIVLFYSQHRVQRENALQYLLNMVALSSRTTHGEARAVAACQLMALFIDKALLIDPSQDAGKDAVLKLTESELSALGVLPEEIDAIACGTYRHKTRHEISSSGYVVHSLEAALWSFWHSTTFAEGALLAANLGDDADTVAAIYGQLAGAYYGEDGIPASWRERLAWYDKISNMALTLHDANTSRLPQDYELAELAMRMQVVANQSEDEQTLVLASACYELGIMQPIGLDWPQASVVMALQSSLTPAEQEQAQSAVIATWSRLDCCCMLTALIRMGRFCDNLLYDAVRSGLVAMILQRLSQLLEV